MQGSFTRALIRLASRKKASVEPGPLLVELLDRPSEGQKASYSHYPFSYFISEGETGWKYTVTCDIPDEGVVRLRRVVREVSDGLDPASIEPLSFRRLVDVLGQMAAGSLGAAEGARLNELGELVAYEAIGLSRFLALARDDLVTEFYVDSDASPLYLDHARVGRCETTIMLTQREREALETHMDTFSGYTLDYATPSLKNDLEVAGARLRVSLDLEPLSVNRFSLDVRRLSVLSFTLPELVRMGAISDEAGAFLVAWSEEGGNMTIIGETGTGKTTLMNAIDEQVNPRLRRVYIEDAVETKNLLERGFHQVKIKVDPFERGTGQLHSKELEIVKVLHRSPDLVILSEIQSEEHSRAFFHALSAGVRGMQTFHASTVEQAIRRWTNAHKVPKQSLLELGVLVQMARPERLGPVRQVSRVCVMAADGGEPRIRDVFMRDRDSRLQRVVEWDRVEPPRGRSAGALVRRIQETQRRLRGEERSEP
ncbi:MAG TPA: ATPase, T2SS/T4P/T4SS family [Nitrososphaerales archaeon]|nr:ATPase, T2SS/T4P/T4SS family [Nitrososphaerales archaeon]